MLPATTAIEKAIRSARTDLMLDHPFFGCIALRLKVTENTELTDTCATDGKHLYYAPAFIEKLAHKQLVGLLAHEAMHIACQHTLRRDHRHPEAWNIACDYAINSILQKEGFTLPPDGCVDVRFEGWSAERIYREIVVEIPVSMDSDGEGDSQGGGGDSDTTRQPRQVKTQSKPNKSKSATAGSGEDEKNEKGSTSADPKISSQRANNKVKQMAGAVLDAPPEESAAMQVSVIEAAMMAQKQGRLPLSIRRVLGNVIRPPIDWRTILQEFIIARVKDEYTWKRPNKRYTEVFLPTRKSYAMAEIVFAIDSSGSVDERKLALSFDSVQAAIDVCRPDKVHVVVCDASVHKHETYGPGEPITTDAPGGGGTNFAPVFELIEREGIQPVGLVYFTDGDGYFPDEPPEYPVLWLLHSGERQLPWGSAVVMNSEV